MKRRNIVTQLSIAVFGLAMLASNAAAQQKDLRDQLIGTWDFVVAEATAPDGKKSFPFGEAPNGILLITPDGYFSDIKVAKEAPKLSSNNRLGGTPEEYAAIARQSVAVTGTYAIDEAKKTVTFTVVTSTFTNSVGEVQVRTIDKLTANEFVNTNPNVVAGRGASANVYKRRK
jgi:hypothetical protein